MIVWLCLDKKIWHRSQSKTSFFYNQKSKSEANSHKRHKPYGWAKQNLVTLNKNIVKDRLSLLEIWIIWWKLVEFNRQIDYRFTRVDHSPELWLATKAYLKSLSGLGLAQSMKKRHLFYIGDTRAIALTTLQGKEDEKYGIRCKWGQRRGHQLVVLQAGHRLSLRSFLGRSRTSGPRTWALRGGLRTAGVVAARSQAYSISLGLFS